MQTHIGTELLRAPWVRCVACIGTFDGVHWGHRQVISTAVQHAKSLDLPSVLVTFDRHPAQVLAPDRCPPALCSLDSCLEWFRELGVSVAVVLAFNKELSQTSATDFLSNILVGAIKAGELVVGHDFAMGRGREGTADWLAARVPTHVVPPFLMEGDRVSSSAVRQAIQAGRVEQAALLLGRPFAIEGVVVHGRKLGRQLGFPTLNVEPTFDQVCPANGIYAGEAETPYGVFAAAISIGTRPAVGGQSLTREAYLLDYPGHSLYGTTVRLNVRHRLRDELMFDSTEGLVNQMRRDIDEVGRMMKAR